MTNKKQLAVNELTCYKGIVIYTDGWMCGFYDDNDNMVWFRTLSACKRHITNNDITGKINY